MRSFCSMFAHVLACSACYPAVTPQPAGVDRNDAIGRPEPSLATLLSYEVLAPPDRSRLLADYCTGTELKLDASADDVSCGPFWSGFEAALIAGLVPGGRVEQIDVYADPTTPEPWTHLSAPYARNPTDVRTKRMFDRRFALVTWKLDGAPASKTRWALENDDPAAPLPEHADVEREIYEIRGSDPHLLVKLPWSHPFEVSSGLALAATKGNVAFLEVRGSPVKPGQKSEQLRGFQTGSVARDKLFDVPFSAWQKQADAPLAKLTVSRVVPAPGGLRITPYLVELTFSVAAKDVVVEKNVWTDARWRGKAPLPDLVDKISIVKGKAFDESLEAIE